MSKRFFIIVLSVVLAHHWLDAEEKELTPLPQTIQPISLK